MVSDQNVLSLYTILSRLRSQLDTLDTKLEILQTHMLEFHRKLNKLDVKLDGD